MQGQCWRNAPSIVMDMILTIVAGMLLIGLNACSEPPAAPMRIGTNVWPGYEPLYLARELGYLGTAVHLVEHTSASQTLRDFRNGVLDAAALTLDEVLLLAQDNRDLRIALVMDISNGADAIIAHPPIARIDDLKGKRVGVESSALGAYLLTRALEKANLTTGDIQIVSRRAHEHLLAFNTHAVDAVVTFEPTRTQLLQAGGNIIFDSTQIPDEIVDVLVVRTSYWDAHPERIETLLGNWFRALAYMATSPDTAATILAKRLRVPATEIAAIYTGLRLPDPTENRRLLISEGTPPPLAITAHTLNALMFKQRLLRVQPQIDPLFPSAEQWRLTPPESP